MISIELYNAPNPSRREVALGSIGESATFFSFVGTFVLKSDYLQIGLLLYESP